MLGTEKKFRDPIHNFIQASPIEVEIINTPIFQKLHNIKQLSLGYYVYHGAEHSRFGHMLGAMHLAGLAFDSLKRNSEKLGESFDADDTDKKTIRIAALLHDVGHAPFSHSLENILGDKHEKYSVVLVENYFADLIKKANVEVETVKNLILGDPYPGKHYLSKIVSGQLDVDRLDYLLRDSYYAGVSYGKFDLSRIIDQLCVVNKEFVVLEGGYESVEQLVFARYQMYQQVYFHKTKRAFELMLWECGEILKENGILDYPSKEALKEKKVQEEYVQYDDRWFLNKIFDEKNPSEVKTIAKMIRERIPYIETYSPTTYRKKSDTVRLEPENSIEGLKPIEIHLIRKLSELNIKKHEFLADHVSRSPYDLMPNYTISDETEPEGTSIQIYYKNNKLMEPIEKRSHVVFTLAKNQPFMIRGFVIPEKYNIVREFLKSNYDYSIPIRE